MSQIYMMMLMKMELPYKESKAFIDWYMETYAPLTMGDDWKYELPIIYSDNPEETSEQHHAMWAEVLTKILWPRKSKRIYKDRWNYKQTWLDYVLGWLWLGYWPTFKSNSEKDEYNNTTR